jgi:hypothetical protein
MTKRRQLIFALLFFVPSLLFAQSKVAIYGSLWENGTESTCNWFFKEDLACMQLIFKGAQNETIDTRLIMNAQTNKLIVVTISNGNETCISVSADSIQRENHSQLNFKSTGSTKEFENLGICERYNAKNHTNEYLMFSFENNAISLSKFKNFIKNDVVFEFLSSSANHQFPAQALTVSATGELQRSYLANSISESFSDAIFIGTCE